LQFPQVNGDNLQRNNFKLPRDFEGDLNILLIAFQRWQQTAIDTWLPLVQQLERTHEGVRYYELPTIQRLNRLARTFINEGMRAGIPDQTARERTITLYVDKIAFRQALELPHEDDIYVLLVDRQGRVLWRASGPFSSDEGRSLAKSIEERQRA
jgi:hypothetical protein